jgi:uncharacterized membrane protein YfcA
MVPHRAQPETCGMSNGFVPSFLPVALVFFGAGAVKGVLGMGLPTVAMGMLGLMMPVGAAAAVLTLPSLVTNVWQACVGPGLGAALRRLWTMQLGIVLGTAAAPWLFPDAADAVGRDLLGGCLLAYGAIGLLGWQVPATPARAEPAVGFAAGAATGLLTGLTGVFVLPAVPFLQSLALPKDALAQGLGLSFTTSTLALGAVLAARGHLDANASLDSLAMTVPALVGMWAGQWMRRDLGEFQFRRFFFAGLLVLGGCLLAG